MVIGTEGWQWQGVNNIYIAKTIWQLIYKYCKWEGNLIAYLKQDLLQNLAHFSPGVHWRPFYTILSYKYYFIWALFEKQT